MSNLVQLGPQYFPKSSVGTPVGAGSIYVGQPDTDPTVVGNQKLVNALQEDGSFVAMSQPITLSAGGIPLYSGSPVTLYTSGDYSLTVLDINDAQIYYIPSTPGAPLVPGNYYYPDATETDQGLAGNGSTVRTYVDAIGTTNKATIFFKHDSGNEFTDYVFSTLETIPNNIILAFEKGARLDPDAGIVITINGGLEAELYQIFTGSGTITFGTGSMKEVYPQWWGASPDATSTVNAAAIQAALNSYSNTFLSAGTYSINAAISPGTQKHFTGAGSEQTILENDGIGGVILYAPHLGGSLSEFRIDGQSVGSSIGIQSDDTHRTHSENWGSIRIQSCDKGVFFNMSGTAGTISYNKFGRWQIHDCDVGVELLTDVNVTYINANNFGEMFITSVPTGGTGLIINGASGNTWDVLTVEDAGGGLIGIDVLNGDNNVVLGGWIEGFAGNEGITIAVPDDPNPGVYGFTYLGSIDNSPITGGGSTAQASILPYDSGLRKVLGGKWYFNMFEGQTAGSIIRQASLQGVGSTTASSTTGVTISVAQANSVYLNYGAGEEITDFTNEINGQVIQIVTVNTNATIDHGGNFALSADWDPGANDTLTLMYSALIGKWIEIGRSNNS